MNLGFALAGLQPACNAGAAAAGAEGCGANTAAAAATSGEEDAAFDFTLLRVFRVARIFKLLKTIQGIRALFNTMPVERCCADQHTFFFQIGTHWSWHCAQLRPRMPGCSFFAECALRSFFFGTGC